MSIKTLFFLFLISLNALLILSCKKEQSCAGCDESNKPPIARAGRDTALVLPNDSIVLDGSASYDSDGTISGYKWTKISGPYAFNISDSNAPQTQVSSLIEGIYQFKLTVTDIGGLSSRDTVKITVNASATINNPPIAHAGLDKIITLPANSITLNGVGSFDPDNNSISFNWSKISGPSSYNISSSNTVQTTLTGLVEGIYQFQLTVTDNGGLSDADTVKITVNPQGPQNELIIDSLTWNYWQDSNDPTGSFDEIYLAIYDTTNIPSYTPISIFVKLDSVGTWVAANPVINGNCTPPYTFSIWLTASPDTMLIFIHSCPLNFNLIGTGASVKIIY